MIYYIKYINNKIIKKKISFFKKQVIEVEKVTQTKKKKKEKKIV